MICSCSPVSQKAVRWIQETVKFYRGQQQKRGGRGCVYGGGVKLVKHRGNTHSETHHSHLLPCWKHPGLSSTSLLTEERVQYVLRNIIYQIHKSTLPGYSVPRHRESIISGTGRKFPEQNSSNGPICLWGCPRLPLSLEKLRVACSDVDNLLIRCHQLLHPCYLIPAIPPRVFTHLNSRSTCLPISPNTTTTNLSWGKLPEHAGTWFVPAWCRPITSIAWLVVQSSTYRQSSTNK